MDHLKEKYDQTDPFDDDQVGTDDVAAVLDRALLPARTAVRSRWVLLGIALLVSLGLLIG